jgi:hypothetical protein
MLYQWVAMHRQIEDLAHRRSELEMELRALRGLEARKQQKSKVNPADTTERSDGQQEANPADRPKHLTC